MPQHISVEEYCSDWEKQFITEKKLIKSILKDNVAEIYHIGSTAVKGLKAKPIIDIMPVVYDLSDVDKAAVEFEKIGYEYLGEFGIKGRRYLRKGGDERTHQIHIFKINDKRNIVRHLSVRDYLSFNTNEAQLYGELKEKLSTRFPYDIDGYCKGKEKFMRQLEQSAMTWYENTIRQAYICDVDEIMEIWITENIKAHNFIPSDYWKKNYSKVKNALPQAEIYVSVCRGKTIGFTGVNGNYVEGIFVKANQQRNGTGSALLNKIKTLKPTLTLSVYKKNVSAVSFYLKNGFRVTNEGIDESTGEYEYTMKWEKERTR